MAKTKILITIDWFLPGTNSGGPVRSIANMVDNLPEFDFYIVTRNTDYCANVPYDTIRSNAWNKLSEHVLVYYFSEEKLNKSSLFDLVKSCQPDVLFVNGIYSKFFSILPVQIGKKLGITTIVSSRGMLSPHGLALKSLKKKLFLRFVHLVQFYKNVHFHVTIPEEQQHVKSAVKRYKSINTIPNFPRKNNELISPIEKKAGVLKLISVGRIAPEKGTLDGIKALQYCNGNVTLDLFGTIYDENYWQACKQEIEKLDAAIQVNYKGVLPSENVLETFNHYHFLLLPSKGENYGHAIAESFLAKRPVIISKNTPWKNLEKKGLGFDVLNSELSATLQQAIDMKNNDYFALTQNIGESIDDLFKIEEIKEKYIQLFTK